MRLERTPLLIETVTWGLSGTPDFYKRARRDKKLRARPVPGESPAETKARREAHQDKRGMPTRARLRQTHGGG